jgi:uncharacterized membrane protein YiaA
MDMEKLSQFPFMFMICHFSYEKNIIWGKPEKSHEIRHIQIVTKILAGKCGKKNMQLACIGLLMLGLFNSPL